MASYSDTFYKKIRIPILLLASIQDSHEFFSCNGFVFVQVTGQFMQLLFLFLQNIHSFLILAFNHLHDLPVHLGLCFIRTRHGSVSTQISVADSLQRRHAKGITHSILRDHGSRDFGRLFDII